MPTIEMTLHKDYVPNWDTWCGLRELSQNCIDSEKEFGAPASIWYRKSSGTLIFKNEGITIPREALLIGYSTKRGDDNLSGQFGEGLNLGLLALVRQGLTVVIRNGKEVWKPFLEKSKKFDADVLKMNVAQSQKDYHGIQIEVKRISDDDWNLFRNSLLFLAPPEEDETIKTSRGSILTNEKYKGKIFVKNIFVEQLSNTQYGYDMNNLHIDRDRKMVNKHDVEWQMSVMWNEAIDKNLAQTSAVYKMLEEENNDTKDLHYQAYNTTSDKIYNEFRSKYGEETVPVQSLAQSKEVEHFGKRGVVVSKSLAQVLEKKVGNYETLKQTLIETTKTYLSWRDLTQQEKNNLETVINMVKKVAPDLSLDQIDVVEFQDDKINGMRQDDRIIISRTILSTLPQLLATMVHEYQHSDGRDAEWSFHYSVETTLALIAITNWKLNNQEKYNENN